MKIILDYFTSKIILNVENVNGNFSDDTFEGDRLGNFLVKEKINELS